MQKSSIFILSGIFLISITFGIAGAASLSEAEKLAHELLQVSGATRMAPMVTEQLIKQQSKSMPDIPEAFWTAFTAEIKTEALNKKIAKVYAKHFTVEDMKAIISFYNTSAGKKFIGTLPKIAEDSREAFRRWGMELREKITEKLKTADLKKMREEENKP